MTVAWAPQVTGLILLRNTKLDIPVASFTRCYWPAYNSFHRTRATRYSWGFASQAANTLADTHTHDLK